MLLLILVKREREREERHLGGGCGLLEAGEERSCPLPPQATLLHIMMLALALPYLIFMNRQFLKYSEI